MSPDPDQVREWVERSCAAQGVPFHVTDPDVLVQVAILLRPSDPIHRLLARQATLDLQEAQGG